MNTDPRANERHRWHTSEPKLVIILLLFTILTGCNLPFTGLIQGGESEVITKAQIVFTVNPLKPLPEGEALELTIVDEVTGIPYNQERIQMNPMPQGQFGTVYEARVGSMLTYLFYKVKKDGARVPEVGSDGQPIRCRYYFVKEPGVTTETIAGWEDDLPASNAVGTITGTVVHNESRTPLADILVTAGGKQTVTDGYGNFVLYPLPQGIQNLTAISMTGLYQPSQYRTEIAGGKITPAEITMIPSEFREVTFKVEVPEETIEGVPIRIAGNLAQLGNTFTDQGSGMSGDTRQMPFLTSSGDGWFTTTIILPVGIDIRYKYTLGDGFWNAEHTRDLAFITHQLILPAGSDRIEIDDRVATWRSDSTDPVWFQVNVPPYTPQEEPIGIQFRISEWSPALPMFRIKDDTWAFPLISPHNFSGEIPYRYCRNSPCTENSPAGVESFHEVRTSSTTFSQVQLNKDVITEWAFLSPSVSAGFNFDNLTQIDHELTAGIALPPSYNPNQQSYMTRLLSSTGSRIKQVILSPAWEIAPQGSVELFRVSLIQTPRWQKLSGEVHTAHLQDLDVSLFPQVIFNTPERSWWEYPVNNQGIWQSWLTDYRKMMYQYAEFAEENEVEVLILGGDWLTPALPIGENLSRYNQPGNIASLWEETLSGIRDRYSGQIGWMLTTETAKDPPDFLNEIDVLYFLWDLPAEPGLDQTERIEVVEKTIDDLTESLVIDLDKTFFLVLAIPSIAGFGEECIPSPSDPGACVDLTDLRQGPSVLNPVTSDLEIQAAYYHAILSAVSSRDWIKGVISQGYYPQLALNDTSTSIHGKPAEDVFNNWLLQVLGN